VGFSSGETWTFWISVFCWMTGESSVSEKLKTEEGIEIEVREARAGDVPLLLELIRKMAAFERLEVSAREASLGEAPAAKALLVRLDGDSLLKAVGRPRCSNRKKGVPGRRERSSVLLSRHPGSGSSSSRQIL